MERQQCLRKQAGVDVPFHHQLMLRAFFVTQVTALVSHSLYTPYNAHGYVSSEVAVLLLS